MHIGIVVGEASGDILGAALIKALRKLFPTVEFSGMGGQKMAEQSFHSLFDSDRIAVMGFIEPLKRLGDILHIRKQLFLHFTHIKPDVVIGIDAPDFNLGLELKLRRQGIKTVHYVSPSVWAWRKKRIKKISKAVDLMLTLFPFETAIYKENNIPVAFIGHPLADQLPLRVDQQMARSDLNLNKDAPVVAILPGSRQGEIELLLPVFLESASLIKQAIANVEFVIPAINPSRQQLIEEIVQKHPSAKSLVIHYAQGQSRTALMSADTAMLTSGTVTLEAMLLKAPMVVAYKAKPLVHAILSRLIKVRFFSLPNLIAGKELVPELLQDQVKPSTISSYIISWLEDPHQCSSIKADFLALHQQLQVDAAAMGAEKIAELIDFKNQHAS